MDRCIDAILCAPQLICAGPCLRDSGKEIPPWLWLEEGVAMLTNDFKAHMPGVPSSLDREGFK